MKYLWMFMVASLLWLRAAEPSLTTELDRGEAYLGDAVELRIGIRHDQGWTFEQTALPDTLGDAKVLDFQWVEPAGAAGGETSVLELRARLAFYKLGPQEVPPITIQALGSDGSFREFQSDPLNIEILSMLEDNETELAEGKDQIGMKEPPLWLYILILVVVITAIVFLVIAKLTPKRQAPAVKSEPLLPPYEEAQANLAALTNGSLLKEGRVKDFYVALNHIVRRYYARLYNIQAEEMTSFEMEDWIRFSDHTPTELLVLNREFQELCDRVKFAKYDPMESETKDLVNGAYQIVELLKPRQEVSDVAPR